MRCSPESIRCFCILPPVEIIQSYVCSYYLQTKGNQKIKNTVQAAKQPPSAILYFLITKTSTESQNPPVLSLSQVHIKRKNKRSRERKKEGREGERDNNTCFLFNLYFPFLNPIYLFSLINPGREFWRQLSKDKSLFLIQQFLYSFSERIFLNSRLMMTTSHGRNQIKQYVRGQD